MPTKNSILKINHTTDQKRMPTELLIPNPFSQKKSNKRNEKTESTNTDNIEKRQPKKTQMLSSKDYYQEVTLPTKSHF